MSHKTLETAYCLYLSLSLIVNSTTLSLNISSFFSSVLYLKSPLSVFLSLSLISSIILSLPLSNSYLCFVHFCLPVTVYDSVCSLSLFCVTFSLIFSSFCLSNFQRFLYASFILCISLQSSLVFQSLTC